MNSSGDFLVLARPEWLWVLPVVLLFLFRRPTAAREDSGAKAGVASPWRNAIDADLLTRLLADAAGEPHAGATWSSAAPRRQFGRPLRQAALVVLLVLALAGPQIPHPGGPADPKPLRPEVARVVVVDLSPAFDALPTAARERARTQLRRFVAALPPGETGLLAFAGDAWLVVPPTEDAAALDTFLAELSSAAAPVQGDRPERALVLSRQVLAATGSRAPAIYWLNVRPAGPPTDLPETPGGVRPIFLEVNGGLDDWLGQAGVGSGGARTGSSLNLGAAERFDLGPLVAMLGLLLFVGWPGEAGTAQTAVRQGKTGVVGLVAGTALIAALAAADAAQAADPFGEGEAHYRAGRYADAVSAFSAAVAARPRDPAAHYNRGNALARAGRLREALAAYDVALRLRPDDGDATYNRDLVARLLQSPQASQSPPPPQDSNPPPVSQSSAEAQRAAAQWLRLPPAEPPGILARKLAAEAAREQQGAAPTPAGLSPSVPSVPGPGPLARPGTGAPSARSPNP